MHLICIYAKFFVPLQRFSGRLKNKKRCEKQKAPTSVDALALPLGLEPRAP